MNNVISPHAVQTVSYLGKQFYCVLLSFLEILLGSCHLLFQGLATQFHNDVKIIVIFVDIDKLDSVGIFEFVHDALLGL